MEYRWRQSLRTRDGTTLHPYHGGSGGLYAGRVQVREPRHPGHACTLDAHEPARTVRLFLQPAADGVRPAADAFRFIEQVPCDWERSLLVDGKIGDYCVFARQGRGTDNWYIGGITDENAREIEVPLTMLEKDRTYTLTLYRDAEDADWDTNPYAYQIEEREVSSDDTLRIRMAPGGGFAAEMKTKN